MRKHLLLLLGLIVAVFMARGQTVNYFHCLEVMGGGEVMLTWAPPGDQAEFVAYKIFNRVPPGNFNLIHSEPDYNSTNYLHNISVASTQSVQYYIVTKQSTLPDDTSYILSSIHLSISLNSADPIIASLNWNELHDPLLPGSSAYYRVMMHNTADPIFSIVGSTINIHYSMPVSVCRDTLTFQIEIDHDFGCTSKSNISSIFVEDITPPPMPMLDSVSINPYTGEAILGWRPSTAGDAAGYVIYHVKTDINDTLYWIPGIDSTYCFDLSFDPCSEYRSYAISAYDSCDNISPGSYDIPQRTILLNEVDFDPCSMVNTLSWTEYINMNPALEGYLIYLSIDGASFEVLTSVQQNVIIYEHEGLEPGHTYQYFIRAFSIGNAVTSSSCIRQLTTWQYKQPIDNRMENASVENSEMVALSLLPDTFAFVPMLNLYRAENESGPFSLIAELEVSGQEVLYFDDLSAEVNYRSYYYYTSLIDSCGNEVLASDLMRTILLQGENSGQLNMLDWNAFEGWPVNVASYEVFRAVNETGSFEKIGETPGNILMFEDDISSLSGEFSMIRYVIRALQDDDATRFSWSNEIFFEYIPNIYLPNAFTPNGKNPIYKAVGNFADFKEYRLDVYNRWGELIFTSRDFSLGWDGTYKGSTAPGGVYVCILSYSSNQGASTTLKTTFLLLR